MTKGPKILTADIETLPITTHNWSLFDEPRALDRLVKDWAIFMGAFKWMHKKPVHIMDTESTGDPYDDKEVTRWLCDALDEADIVVGQNVQKFDLGKIRARAVYHGLKPFREPQVADTLLMSREVARFTSNKLEYVSGMTSIQKSKHLKFPGFSLWLGILDGNPAAYKEARDYNKVDVLSTEEWYLKLRPWVRKHPNVAQYFNDEKQRCPRCGSEHVEPGEIIHRGVGTYQAYRCLADACGGHSRTRFTMNSKGKRASLLTCI